MPYVQGYYNETPLLFLFIISTNMILGRTDFSTLATWAYYVVGPVYTQRNMQGNKETYEPRYVYYSRQKIQHKY